MSIPQQVMNAHPADDDYDDGRQASRSAFERVPPQDLDAEQSVLGGMLLSKDAIDHVIEAHLTGRDFYKPAHETIHDTIMSLYSHGEPADPITVSAELAKTGDLVRVGGAPYLHTLVTVVPTAASAGYYAEIVRDQAVFRRLAETGTRIVQAGYAAEGDPIEVTDRMQAELFKTIDSRGQEDITSLGERTESMIDRIAARKNDDGKLRGLPSGFKDLDSLTRGFRGGQFIIVAGRPAMGKSTLATDFMRACSVERKIPAVMFSLEMGKDEIDERILSATSRVAQHHISSGDVTEDDWRRIARATPDLEASPLYIDDSPSLTCMDIMAKARKLKQKHGIQLVVIDYIQLMKSGLKVSDRQQEVTDISRNLKLLAKELDIPVIGLSQLNRGPEQRTDKRPAMSDLRESGSLEQDADIVILLHREDAYEKESARAGEVDLIVAKHRGGPTTTITVAAQLHYARFVDMAQT